MKIVILGQRWYPFSKTVIRGGGPKVELDHLLLLREDNELHHITNLDSEELEGVTTHKVSNSLSSAKPDKERNSKISKLIESIGPEVILCHDGVNIPLLKALNGINIPIMCWVHNSIFLAGPTTITEVPIMYDLAKAGHSFICVSETSRKEWDNWLGRTGQRNWVRKNNYSEKILQPKFIFRTFLHNHIIQDKPEPVEAELGFLTIGRLSKQKRLPVALSSDPNLKVYCPPADNANSVKLQKDLEEKFGEERFVLGTKHPDLMEILRKSKGLLCCSNESFGLVATEANTYGVPVILQNPQTEHAVEEACRPAAELGGFFRVESRGKHLERFLKEFTPPSIEEKKKIIDATWNYYNFESSKSRLVDKIQECLSHYRSVRKC